MKNQFFPFVTTYQTDEGTACIVIARILSERNLLKGNANTQE